MTGVNHVGSLSDSGYRERTRQVLQQPQDGGQECSHLSEVQPCEYDMCYRWQVQENASRCELTVYNHRGCGNGTKYYAYGCYDTHTVSRRRGIIRRCLINLGNPLNVSPLVLFDHSFTKCTVFCSYMYATQRQVPHDLCDGPRPIRSEPCYIPCSDDCVLSDWSSWSSCSESCDDKTRSAFRSRHRVQLAAAARGQ